MSKIKESITVQAKAVEILRSNINEVASGGWMSPERKRIMLMSVDELSESKRIEGESPEITLHKIIVEIGPSKTHELIEHIWYLMIDALHNNGENFPDELDTDDVNSAISYWEKSQLQTLRDVIENEIYDADTSRYQE